ncbi:MgtC/SapB family protein [Sphingorhabdus sp.]|uniref:MgtC/SapB family protein n=1 Tax=Sphingorhabdus sp. TaxID=1902408 RepID=UPI00391AA153
MNIVDYDLVIPIIGSVAAGAIIGAEREYRASPAGFRTHILVSLSCCLLMLSAVHQIRWLTDTPEEIIRIDPVRMAHGLLTGIGFLCGGVIFRDGFNVRGLTTAASLWSTAALGILFGIGFYTLAIVGSLATLLVLAAANLTDKIFPQRRLARLKVRYKRQFSPTRDAFVGLVQRHEFPPAAVSQYVDNDMIEYSITLSSADQRHLNELLSDLDSDDGIIGFEYLPHDA